MLRLLPSPLLLDLGVVLTAMLILMAAIALADRVLFGAWPWGWPS